MTPEQFKNLPGYAQKELTALRQNVDSLEAVTHRENCLRGVSPAAVAYKKMYCVNGHELFGDNVLIMASRPRKRVCRSCSRERMRRRKQRAML